MTKTEFILALAERLSPLPWDEVEERLAFYVEMIEDRMEEGLSEEEAVSAAGTVDEIAAQIVSDIPLAKLVKEKMKPQRRLRAWEIVLLVLGSPIWLSLLIAAFAILLSLYAVLWSVIVSLWAAFGAVAVCAPAGIAAGIGFLCGGDGFAGVAVIGAAVVCAGLSVYLFFGCRAATKGVLLLTKKIALGTKRCFVKRGNRDE